MDRESLDRHITGNYGEDQLRYINLVDDEVDDSGPEDDFEVYANDPNADPGL